MILVEGDSVLTFGNIVRIQESHSRVKTMKSMMIAGTSVVSLLGVSHT